VGRPFSPPPALRPSDPEPYLERGRVWDALDRPESAIDDYTRAIELQPDSARPYFLRGVAHLTAADTARAALDLQRVGDLHGDSLTQQAARSVLLQIGRRPVPTQQTPPSPQVRVYLHFSAEADRPLVQRLVEELRGSGIRVEGAELRREATTGDVRYFHREDAGTAARIGSMAESFLAREGHLLKLQPIFLGERFRGVPVGQIEVWLPPFGRRGYTQPS
jgi:tetratricopeptide (TPR) repeat protein